jgi:hypothetical protein
MISALTGSIATDVVASVATPVSPAGSVSLRALSLRSAQVMAETVACPEGGTVEVALGTNGTSAAVRHRGCRTQGESGAVWTLDGDPSLNINFTVSAANETVTSVGLGMTGAVRASSAGKSSRCAMNVTVTSTVAFGPGGEPLVSGRMSGTACGVAVDDTF